MIDLYYYPTPNSLKITIYCEEAGLPYRIIALDLPGGAHKRPEYIKINPNGQMPARTANPRNKTGNAQDCS